MDPYPLLFTLSSIWSCKIIDLQICAYSTADISWGFSQLLNFTLMRPIIHPISPLGSTGTQCSGCVFTTHVLSADVFSNLSLYSEIQLVAYMWLFNILLFSFLIHSTQSYGCRYSSWNSLPCALISTSYIYISTLWRSSQLNESLYDPLWNFAEWLGNGNMKSHFDSSSLVERMKSSVYSSGIHLYSLQSRLSPVHLVLDMISLALDSTFLMVAFLQTRR